MNVVFDLVQVIKHRNFVNQIDCFHIHQQRRIRWVIEERWIYILEDVDIFSYLVEIDSNVNERKNVSLLISEILRIEILHIQVGKIFVNIVKSCKNYQQIKKTVLFPLRSLSSFWVLISDSENNTQSTQLLNEDDEDIEDEDESTTSSEKPPSRSMTNASASSKKRTK